MKVLFSIGHSTLSTHRFQSLLEAHQIQRVVDIRSIPMSRYCPQFNQRSLKNSLKSVGIRYTHLKALGGLRHAKKDSINTGWHNASFRGYADYMQTTSFQKGLERLKKMAQKERCVILCAEAVPWRCHRSLVCDALTKQKWKCFHVQSKKTAKRHEITPFLRVRKGILVYS